MNTRIGVQTAFQQVVTPAIFAVVVSVALLLALPTEASAYELNGCAFDTDSIKPVSYRFYLTESSTEAAVGYGERAWDRTSAPGYFKEKPDDADPEISVEDGPYMTYWTGQMTGGCASDGTWVSNEVEIAFNTTKMDELNAMQKGIVSMHELGHAYGLAHVDSGCHVMVQGASKFSCSNLPSSDDVQGVTDIYTED